MSLPTHLVTARLRLRPPTASDADWIAREIAHPEVAPKLTSLPFPYTLDDAQAWLDGMGHQNGVYIIVSGFTESGLTESDLTGSCDPIGSVTVKSDPEWAELGYWLCRAHWGQGYMTEAARAVLAAYFSVRPGPVVSGHVLDNLQSANTLRKLGFANTEVFTQATARGEVEVQKMTLTRSVWLDHAKVPGDIPV